MTDPETVEEALTGGQIVEEWGGEPVLEAQSRVIVPKRGKLFEDDGSMRICIIRPCISRGKRIRGLPPIYTPKMLAESAAVFTDWPMYEDHLAEQAVENFREQLVEAQLGDIVEWLEERARRIKEIGGRVDRSFFNPDIVFEDDEAFGFRKGGVEGRVVPQRRIREMIEDDPKLLNVSINAWPSGAKPGTAPWDSSARGMLIEGIRPKPRGSVDWVFRGGAGGRLLAEEDVESAVSVLEAWHAADRDEGPLAEEPEVKKKLSELKPGELREWLSEEAAHLLPALAENTDPQPTSTQVAPAGGITAEQLAEALEEHGAKLAEEFEAKLGETDEEFEARLEEAVAERTRSQSLASKANEVLAEAERNGLPKAWVEQIAPRYANLPNGPSNGIRIEESDLEVEQDGKTVTLTEEQLVEQRVREDVAAAIKLMEASGGTPHVRGFGAAAPDPHGTGGSKRPAPRHSAFREKLRDEGMLKLAEGESEDDAIRRLVSREDG